MGSSPPLGKDIWKALLMDGGDVSERMSHLWTGLSRSTSTDDTINADSPVLMLCMLRGNSTRDSPLKRNGVAVSACSGDNYYKSHITDLC